MSYAVETVNLSKKFSAPRRYRDLVMHPFSRTEVVALQGIDIQVRKGELFGLLGPNGAGKTTLMKILCTLVLPTGGSAFVNSYDVTKNENIVKRSIGYVVSDERSFFWRLTGSQNLRFFSTLNNISTQQASKRINELTELLGLENLIDKPFKDYSSGMKQKLAIARGMLTNPEILFLDEPTTTLDPITTKNLRQFIREVIVKDRKKTVILATNNMQEAEDLCNRIAILGKGKLLICESIEKIKTLYSNNGRYVVKVKNICQNFHHNLRSHVIGAKIVDIHREASFNNDSMVTLEIDTQGDNISEIINHIITSGISIEAFGPKKSPLDEIFAKIVA